MRLDDLGFNELRDLTDATVLVAAASSAGIFHALRDTAMSAGELARALDYDERATRIVLLALVETGLLEHDGKRFMPSERCAGELCDPDSPDYAGRGLPHWLRSVRGRARLGEVLRRGGPLERRADERSEGEVARFTAAMAAAPSERVERLVDLCLERRPHARSLLDLGGGPGHIARAFVRRGLLVTLFDTPDIVAHVVDAYRLGDVDGLDVVVGDFTRDPLPYGPFDIVLLSNVIHIFDADANRAMFRKAAGVLTAGGVIAVAEFVRGISPRAANLAVQMLLRTDSGDTYSLDDIRGWMLAAGLVDVRLAHLDRERQVVSGVKAEATSEA